MQRIVKSIIPPEDANTELLCFLASRFTYHNRKEWDKLIREERILLDGAPVSSQTRIQAGMQIEYLVPDLPEPEVNEQYNVVYEDDILLAVDKPGNLPIHPAGRFFKHTLWALLKRDFPDLKPRFISRLDRETSGLVLIAKNVEAHRTCQAAGQAGCMHKSYVAVVEGQFPETLDAEGILVPDGTSPVRKKQRFIPRQSGHLSGCDGKSCRTLFRRRTTGNGLSIVEARLVTGRQHQIRATSHSLGYPLAGDKLYGVDDTCFLRFIEDRMTAEDHRKLRLSHQALHAFTVSLPHPETGRTLTLPRPIPQEFLSLLECDEQS